MIDRKSARRRPGPGRAFALIVVLGCALAATSAAAQTPYPARPVKLILNFPPGGPSDLIARVLGNKLQPRLGQPLVIDSKPGAAGNIGADAVAKSAPDGYTLLMTIDTPLTVNPSLYPTLPFKAADFRVVSLIASSSLMFAVNPKLGVNSVAEFLAKARSQEVTFSSAGNGSPGHVAAAMLSQQAGARLNNIMYKGNTPAVLAVVSGEVEAAIIATPGLLPHVQAGKIRALAVTGAKRSPIAPDVPTTAEAGIPGVEFEVMYLMLAPAATPDAVVARLQREITAALAQPEVQETLRAADLTLLNESGVAAEARLSRARERYAATIKSAGMKIE